MSITAGVLALLVHSLLKKKEDKEVNFTDGNI